MDVQRLKAFVESDFEKSVLPALQDFIRIPNLSPNFDSEVLTNGHMDQAVSLMVHWVKNQNIKSLNLELMRAEGKTPIIFIEIDSTIPGKEGSRNVPTVLMYGHGDKQPPFEGWAEGLGPYYPVVRSRLPTSDENAEDKDTYLYGRGSNDDGYALFSSILAIKALQEQNVPHGRIVILIEFSEESGSCDLPYYLCQLMGLERAKHIRESLGDDAPTLSEDHQDRIGDVDLVVCLDSGVGNYKQPWTTISLRGILVFELHVSLIKEGVHSGGYSGIVADSFRVARMLLSRIEDESTGHIKIPELHGDPIPEWVIEKLGKSASLLGKRGVCEAVPLTEPSVQLIDNDLLQLLLNKTWRPTLTVTGAEGLPAIAQAGNVLRPKTALKVSIRLPPHVVPSVAEKAVLKTITENVPYNAQVEIRNVHTGSGWKCNDFSKWLMDAMETGCKDFFGPYEPAFMGEGGSIPLMKILGDCYPKAQMLITGVAGPGSNAHGPNEHLNLNFCKKVICGVSKILESHATSF